MTDFGEQPQPSPQEAHQSSSGVIQRITEPEHVGVAPARESVLSDIIVQAKAKGKKVDLGEPAIPSPDVTGGFIASGGQDAAGAVFYEGGRIDALLIAADGCSFGHEGNSVLAARNVVFTALDQGTDRIARQANLTRDQISPELEATLLSSHATIQQRFPNGATTAVVAALSQEATPNGQTETYLHYAACGDPQIQVISQDPRGRTRIWRVVQPADLLDRMIRAQGLKPESIEVSRATEERELAVTQFAQATGIPVEQARQQLTQTGIYTYLGGNETPQIRTSRINLSHDLRGHTNVKLMVCSDNAGEKITPEQIEAAYAKGTVDNETFARRLNSLMTQQDLDDGCLAITSVAVPEAEGGDSFIRRGVARLARGR